MKIDGSANTQKTNPIKPNSNPKQTQFIPTEGGSKPIQTQNKANTNPIQTQFIPTEGGSNPKQTQFLYQKPHFLNLTILKVLN